MSNIGWKELNNLEQLEEIKKLSSEKPVVIFKHSSRCSISSMALGRLERSWDGVDHKNTEIYFLDLIQYRNISTAVAETFDVFHQSPQIIVIKDGKAIYDESHMGISYEEISAKVKASSN